MDDLMSDCRYLKADPGVISTCEALGSRAHNTIARMIALALVAAVAIQACSARVLLGGAPDLQAVAKQVSSLTAEAAEGVVSGPMFFVTYYDMYYRVWKVEAAIHYEQTHYDYYGDPELVAQESLAGIDADVALRMKEAAGRIEAVNAKIRDTVAQAAAGVHDDAVLALLSTIQQKYTEATQAVLAEAEKYSQNAAVVARDGIGKDHHPVVDTHTVVLRKLMAIMTVSEKAIQSAVSEADKFVQDALTSY